MVKKEVDIVKKFNHPFIVKCFDCFDHDDKNLDDFYAVFEYCSKGNLSEYMQAIKRQKKMIAQQLAKKFIKQIL